MLNEEFINKIIDKNIVLIYPKKNLLNYIKFIKIFLYNLFNIFLGSNNQTIDQDYLISDCINNFIYNNKNLSNLKNLIMPYEGQAFQKSIFYKQKKLKKNQNVRF